MFFFGKPRFRLVRQYCEDPTGSLFFRSSQRSAKLQVLSLVFYNFLNRFSELSSIALSYHPFLVKRRFGWVRRNQFSLLRWDVFRRYKFRMIKRLRCSFYKRRLFEYKKLKLFYFTLRDKPFRKLAKVGVPLYTRYNFHFLAKFEMRLLTLGVRLSLFINHIQGRQILHHFGLQIGTKRIFYPNFQLEPGNFIRFEDFGFLKFLKTFEPFRRRRLISFSPLSILDLDSLAKDLAVDNRQLYKSVESNIQFSFLGFLKAKVEQSIEERRVDRERSFRERKPWWKSKNVENRSLRQNFRFPVKRPLIFPARRPFLFRSAPLIFTNFEKILTIFGNIHYLVIRTRLGLNRFLSSKFFRFKPSLYMLISWATNQILLTRYPKFSDVNFPFLVDPVMALSFVASRI